MKEFRVCYYCSSKGSRLGEKKLLDRHSFSTCSSSPAIRTLSVHPRVRGSGRYCMWHKLNRLYALGFKAWPLQLTKEIEFVTEKMHFPPNPLTSRHRHTNFLFEG